ncbi:hypothetical protein VPH35_096600 [Triticum aestivum]
MGTTPECLHKGRARKRTPTFPYLFLASLFDKKSAQTWTGTRPTSVPNPFLYNKQTTIPAKKKQLSPQTQRPGPGKWGVGEGHGCSPDLEATNKMTRPRGSAG